MVFIILLLFSGCLSGYVLQVILFIALRLTHALYLISNHVYPKTSFYMFFIIYISRSTLTTNNVFIVLVFFCHFQMDILIHLFL